MSTATNPWEMTVASGGDGKFEIPPSGPCTATIVGLFDVGHHSTTNDKGESYDRQELVLAFELVKRKADGTPHFMAVNYAWSMKDNSNFYDLASNVMCKKFVEGEKFDPRKLVGMTCQVTILHTQKTVEKNGKSKVNTYANISGVQAWNPTDDDGSAKKKPTTTREPITWSITGGQPLPDVSWVPRCYGKTLVMMVEESTEWKTGAVPPSILPRTNVQGQPVAASGDDNDDIPF